MSTLKKDNTGFHLKHLFIGSEGVLGIVTKASIHCPPLPKAVNLAFLGVESFDKILQTYKEAKRDLGEILSSFEMIDQQSIEAVTVNLNVTSPIQQFPFYILIETNGSNEVHDQEKMSKFLERLMADGTISDGTTTNEIGKMRHIWSLREQIAEGLLHDGYVFKYDLSFPLDQFYSIVPMMRKRLAGENVIRCCGYGHIGTYYVIMYILWSSTGK